MDAARNCGSAVDRPGSPVRSSRRCSTSLLKERTETDWLDDSSLFSFSIFHVQAPYLQRSQLCLVRNTADISTKKEKNRQYLARYLVESKTRSYSRSSFGRELIVARGPSTIKRGNSTPKDRDGRDATCSTCLVTTRSFAAPERRT